MDYGIKRAVSCSTFYIVKSLPCDIFASYQQTCLDSDIESNYSCKHYLRLQFKLKHKNSSTSQVEAVDNAKIEHYDLIVEFYTGVEAENGK